MKKTFGVLLALLLLLSSLTSACAPAPQTAGVPEQSGETAASACAETEPPSTEAPSTEAPTESPTEPAAEPETENTTEPAPVLHSGLREDGTFDAGTLFFGDSLTYMFVGSYLIPNHLVGEARYAAMCGSKISAFFDDAFRMRPNQNMACCYSDGFEEKAFYEIAAMTGTDTTAIYMMWGTNNEPNATAETYIELVDYLLTVCPNATVHMQLIPYGNVPYVTVNNMVTEAYGHYQETGEARVFLIDTFTAIDKYPVDGVHQGEPGNRKWYNAIVEHAKANDLPQ